MTREEILEGLYEIKNWKCDGDAKTHKVVTETIKILEQKPILDMIRAEIEQLPTTKCTETHRIYIDADDFKKNVLVILDKYKAESEEEECQM